MNLGELRVLFETSPAVRLLRSQNAPYVVAFLVRQFKQSNAITVPQTELLAALAAWQQEIHEAAPDRFVDRPEDYLAEWCAGDRRWLHRFFESGRDQPVYQLTPDAERVLEFVDRSLQQELGFVGTESRLRMVVDALEGLAIGASDDPQIHLEHLRGQQQQIARQIEQIERGEPIAALEPARIRERFAAAVSLLKQLQGDFRAVEERFKEITREVQQRQLEGRDSRGGILGDVLDAEDALKSEDQGVSFYEFFRFIQSPAQQERLRDVVAQVAGVSELAEQADGLETVRRMMPVLLAEAAKVTETERRLSATLKRLLDASAQRERKRVAELLREIRGLAAGLAENPPRKTVDLEIEASLEIADPFARTFWCEPPRFEQVDLTEHGGDDRERHTAFRQFAGLRRLDFKALRTQISDALALRRRVTLGELLAEDPPQSGVIDLLGYLQIASDDGHVISREAEEKLVLPAARAGSRELSVTVPLVTFVEGASRP